MCGEEERVEALRAVAMQTEFTPTGFCSTHPSLAGLWPEGASSQSPDRLGHHRSCGLSGLGPVGARGYQSRGR